MSPFGSKHGYDTLYKDNDALIVKDVLGVDEGIQGHHRGRKVIALLAAATVGAWGISELTSSGDKQLERSASEEEPTAASTTLPLETTTTTLLELVPPVPETTIPPTTPSAPETNSTATSTPHTHRTRTTAKPAPKRTAPTKATPSPVPSAPAPAPVAAPATTAAPAPPPPSSTTTTTIPTIVKARDKATQMGAQLKQGGQLREATDYCWDYTVVKKGTTQQYMLPYPVFLQVDGSPNVYMVAWHRNSGEPVVAGTEAQGPDADYLILSRQQRSETIWENCGRMLVNLYVHKGTYYTPGTVVGSYASGEYSEPMGNVEPR